MAEFEYSYISKKERVKIALAKVSIGAMIAYSFFTLASNEADLASKISDIASIMIFIFAYVNVMQVKSELAQLFEPPLLNHGLEFFVAFVVLKVASWII